MSDAAPRLLVGSSSGSFLTGLSWPELQALRAIVRRVHMKRVSAGRMTDRECDRIIESYGPKVAEGQLKVAIDTKVAG